MPNVTFNKKYLASLLGEEIDDKFVEHVSKLGFEVESINDDEVNLEITPNRLDLLDAVGFARTMRNFLHKAKKYSYSIEDEPALEIKVDPSVKRIRPYISSVVAEGLNFSEESLQNLINFTEKFCATYGRNRRKIAIGMHNLDAAKPPFVYRAGDDEMYIPLGQSQAVKLSSVLQTTDKGKQYGDIVKKGNVCYYPIFSDSEGIMSFIPILNSERTRVSVSTKNLLVDITGTSEYAVNKAADMLAATLVDLGARVRKVTIDYGNKKTNTPEMEKVYITVPLKKMEEEIGVVIGFNNIISLANKMGYDAALLGSKIRFRVPEYRLDVIDEQDVIEDIAIGYGYDYINPISIPYTQQGGLETITKFNRKAADVMIGLGFSEFANSYLTNEQLNYEKPCIQDEKMAIVLKNPKTEAITIMRTWLLPSVLNNISMSTHERMPLQAFELDMAFEIKSGAPSESYHLAAASVNPRSNFNDMKAVVEGIFDTLGIEHEVREFRHGSFIDGRCAEIISKKKSIGFFGELHPKTLSNFGIEEPAIAMELDLSKILA